MNTPTPPPPLAVPLDDAALDAIDHALAGAYTTTEDGTTDGTHELVGAEYTLTQLLDFWSGIDPADDGVLVGYTNDGTPIFEIPGVCLSERDLIAALVAEVRRLRARHDLSDGEQGGVAACD